MIYIDIHYYVLYMQRMAGTYEINTNGTNVRLGVSVIREPEKQARLSDSGVSDQEEFEQVVAERECVCVRKGLLGQNRREREPQARLPAGSCFFVHNTLYCTHYSGFMVTLIMKLKKGLLHTERIQEREREV